MSYYLQINHKLITSHVPPPQSVARGQLRGVEAAQ